MVSYTDDVNASVGVMGEDSYIISCASTIGASVNKGTRILGYGVLRDAVDDGFVFKVIVLSNRAIDLVPNPKESRRAPPETSGHRFMLLGL